MARKITGGFHTKGQREAAEQTLEVLDEIRDLLVEIRDALKGGAR